MEDAQKTTAKGIVGGFAASVSWAFHHRVDIAGAIACYGGALVVLLTLASLLIDLRKKLKGKHDRD